MKSSLRLMTVLAFLLVASLLATSVALSGQLGDWQVNGTPHPLATSWFNIFFPILHRYNTPFYGVSGQVVDASHHPVSGVTIADNVGHSTMTDKDGNYTLSGLIAGNYDLAPSKSGLVFYPSVQSITLPVVTAGIDFKALDACTETIVNGGFESDSTWWFPATPVTADYSTAQAHTGSWSARTGIISGTNLYSYSSTRQFIFIAPDATSATLRLYIYPTSTEAITGLLPPKPTSGKFGDAVMTYDAQYVIVLDPVDLTVLKTLYWTRTNDQDWVYLQFDLTEFANQEVLLQFGTYNDGYGGNTGMYVDDVSVQVCPSGEPTLTPTATTTAPVYQNLIINSGFEYDGTWDLLGAYPGGYSDAHHYLGSRSMRTGIVYNDWDFLSYSDAGQWVTIPANATSANLHLWVYPISNEVASEALLEIPKGYVYGQTPLSSDVQYVLLLFPDLSYKFLWYASHSDTQAWTYLEEDLLAYKGETVKIIVGTYNDGDGFVTSMYVDEIYLDVWTGTPPTATPTPTATLTPTTGPTLTPTATPDVGTPTATPVGCYDRILNGSFESQTAWVIPVTEFSAGYSTDHHYFGSWSMRTGITYSGWDRFSYSDARQQVTIPVGSSNALLTMHIYPVSSETGVMALPSGQPTFRTFGKDVLSGDVQYVLILDQDFNWIGTLFWDRLNSQAWDTYVWDIKTFAGDTIYLQFGTYNDGDGAVTSMYVDDVSLVTCP